MIDDITDEELAAAQALCETIDPAGNLFCAHCGREAASCYGNYGEESSKLEAACDRCCGHGNEDGWCKPIAPLMRRLLAALAKARRERDEAITIADTRRGHAIDNKERADRAEFALIQIKADLAAAQARIAEVERERDAAVRHRAETNEEIKKLHAVIKRGGFSVDDSVALNMFRDACTTKDARIAALEAVAAYAKHPRACPRRENIEHPCTCGLAEKRKAAGL